jgi:hypothetical protein
MPQHTTENLALDSSSPQLIPGVVSLDVSNGIEEAILYVKLVEIDGDGAVVSNGPSREYRFNSSTTPSGVEVVRALNTSDHSSTTLHAHVLQVLVDAGFVSGSLSGGDPI